MYETPHEDQVSGEKEYAFCTKGGANKRKQNNLFLFPRKENIVTFMNKYIFIWHIDSRA